MNDIINIHYPPDIKNGTGRSTFKQELQKPFLLIFLEISNLIFYTERLET